MADYNSSLIRPYVDSFFSATINVFTLNTRKLILHNQLCLFFILNTPINWLSYRLHHISYFRFRPKRVVT